MSKYYYLIAGLPNIALDDSKLTYSVSDFRQEIDEQLSDADRKLIDLFFLKFENLNAMSSLRNPDAQPDARGLLPFELFGSICKALKEEEKLPLGSRCPGYIINFFARYLAEADKEAKEEKDLLSPDDRLSALYYEYAMRCGNSFVSAWFELNLNINNMLTAITCRKHGLEKARYIVGNNEVAELIRSSNARDFGLSDSVEYLPELQRIAEEPDLIAREKKIDLLKWRWLEENTFFKTFDIEAVFAYLLKLEMIERWVTLDKHTGEATFRQIIGTMKRGSEHTLDEFKRNNNK